MVFLLPSLQSRLPSGCGCIQVIATPCLHVETPISVIIMPMISYPVSQPTNLEYAELSRHFVECELFDSRVEAMGELLGRACVAHFRMENTSQDEYEGDVYIVQWMRPGEPTMNGINLRPPTVLVREPAGELMELRGSS